MKPKKMAILAMLTALAVVGRYGFVSIPNVQPMTTVIIITAVLLGIPSGVIVATLSAIVSNLVLGMGLWTFSQIICWGVVGLLAGFIGRYREKKGFIVFGTIYAIFAGFLYGFCISVPMFVMTDYGFAYYFAGLPFDMAHALGNGVFFILLYPVLQKVFKRFMKNEMKGRTKNGHL